MADEYAWLIEKGTSAPIYFSGLSELGPHWSTDHNEAVRFAREIDAKRVAEGIPPPNAKAEPRRIVEHAWSN